MNAERPRYTSLKDYLRVIRQRRLLVAAITAAFVVAGFVLSIAQAPVYTAEAQIGFRDPLQDLVILGTGGDAAPEMSPQQRSAINAQLIDRIDVAKRVQRDLETEVELTALTGAVDASVDFQTNLVVVEARWGEAKFAARLANSFASEAGIVAEQEFERRVLGFEATVREGLAEARKSFSPGEDTFNVSALKQRLAVIESLQSSAVVAEVAERAEPPPAPTTPRVRRNTVLAGIIGFVLALIAAFVRDTLDSRVRGASEAHAETSLPVVGRVSDTALGHPGLARNGAAPMGELDFESFRVLRTNLAFLRQNGGPLRSVLVTSGLPQEGKTTVSTALAGAAALAGSQVLLVECDLRRPSFATRMGVQPHPGLTDYLRGTASPKEILQVVGISEPEPWNQAAPAAVPGAAASIVVIGAGTQVRNPAELLASDRLQTFFEKVSRAYDLVVIDSSPVLAVVDPLELVPHVDAVLLCVRAAQTTREQARAARAALGHLPSRPAGVVVTGLKRGDPDSYDYYYGEY